MKVIFVFHVQINGYILLKSNYFKVQKKTLLVAFKFCLKLHPKVDKLLIYGPYENYFPINSIKNKKCNFSKIFNDEEKINK